MPGRKYAQVALGLVKQLKSADVDAVAKVAYLAAYTSKTSSYEGLFEYPLLVMADDINETPQRTRTAIERLIDRGLVEYDLTSEWIRLIGWNRSPNCPQNPSVALKRITDLVESGCPDVGMLCRTFAELAIKVFERSEGWNSRDEKYRRMYSALTDRVRQFNFDYDQEFHAALIVELSHYPRSVRHQTRMAIPTIDIELPADGRSSDRHPADTEEESERTGEKENRKRKACCESSAETENPDVLISMPSNKKRDGMPLDATKNSRLGRGD